jgi:ssDNA-binding Zn-finger/Zn-ribbon topoisomerase 1
MSTQAEKTSRICPICGKEMAFIPGNMFDYDHWYCPKTLRDGSGCGHEIELETTTYYDENDEPVTIGG